MRINFKISQLTKDEIYSKSKSPIYYYEISNSNVNCNFSFDHVLIKNFYTASINILQFHNHSWKTILNEYKLMTDPDCDEEGENYFIIEKSILENFKEESSLLRIYLAQGCKEWETFYLKEIKFIKELESESYLDNTDNIAFNQIDSFFHLKNIKILHDNEAINRKYIELNNSDFTNINLNLLN